MFRLTEDTPLVGFHGMANPFGLSKLGLILYDNVDPICRQYHPEMNTEDIEDNDDEFDASMQVEGAISRSERARAQALEAILAYDSLVKAR